MKHDAETRTKASYGATKDIPGASDDRTLGQIAKTVASGAIAAGSEAALASGAKAPAATEPQISKKKLFTIRELTMIAMLGVIAYLCMLIRTPLPLMPPFMDFDFAAVPELIGTFLMGPLPGMFIIIIKLLLKVATTGSMSGGTGEVINFFLNSSLVIFAWLIFNIKKTKGYALAGMLISTLITAVLACFANIYLIIPLYARLFNMNMDAIIGMTAAVNPRVDSVAALVVLGILPFNIIKNGVAAFIVFLIYKRLTKVLRRIGWRA